MSDVSGYEMRNIAEIVARQFINSHITDMECLAAMRKLKSVYVLLNRGAIMTATLITSEKKQRFEGRLLL